MDTLDTYLLCHIAQFLDPKSKILLCLVNKSLNTVINDLVDFVTVPLGMERHKAVLARKLRNLLLVDVVYIPENMRWCVLHKTQLQTIKDRTQEIVYKQVEKAAEKDAENNFNTFFAIAVYMFWGLPFWYFYNNTEGLHNEAWFRNKYDDVEIDYDSNEWYMKELYPNIKLPHIYIRPPWHYNTPNRGM